MSEASRETPTYCIYFVSFRDFDRLWYRVDETGFNKVGYVTQRGTVIHPRLNRGLTETPLTRIRRFPHILRRRTASAQAEVDNVERFFTENKPSIELFNSGMAAIATEQDLSFFDNPIRIPVLDIITHEAFEHRWAVFRSILRPADIIGVIDTRSLISRLIARFDHGTWSHVGCYSGDGTILEAFSAGVVERDIEVYYDQKYRLGVYRASSLHMEGAEAVVRYQRSQLGARYNYRGVFRLAMFKIFGIQPTGSGAKNVSPNDLARSERVRLIHVV